MRDPYTVLGVRASVSEAELRAAYRRAVQLHHPDHNGGSPEAARRFEEVQEAWSQIRRVRGRDATPPRTASAPPVDPGVEDRLAAMERELQAARAAREQARRRAREQAQSPASAPQRPSDEELGYIRTDDSFLKILGDARDELVDGLREKPVTERAADLLDEVARTLRGEPPKRSAG